MTVRPSRMTPTYARVKIPSDEEEAKLRRRLADGDESAREELIIGTLPFAMREADRYTEGPKAVRRDILQQAMLGLVKAAHKFDPERGVKFISYATWWIHQAIKQGLRELDVVRIPEYMRSQLTRLARETESKIDSPADLARLKNTAKTDRQRAGIRALFEHFDIEQCQSNLTDNSFSRGIELYDASEEVEHILSCLPDRMAMILRMRFGIGREKPMKLREVGEELGISRERVRQLQRRSLKVLRDVLKDSD